MNTVFISNGHYCSPMIEVINLKVESGFATSDSNSYVDDVEFNFGPEY